MPDKDIISLDQAQVAAERFLEDQFKNLKKLTVDKVQLASIGSIVVYNIAGLIKLRGGILGKETDTPFKVQVSAADGAIVGYDWQRTETNTIQDLK